MRTKAPVPEQAQEQVRVQALQQEQLTEQVPEPVRAQELPAATDALHYFRIRRRISDFRLTLYHN